jgi:hypothetical protein
MTVIWEGCAGHKWCVHIPFDGDKYLDARACVRVLEENAKFYLEVEIAGNKQRINLGNSCVEARWYVFAAKVCVTNVDIKAHSIAFDLVLRLCIDVNLGPIHIGECVDILRQHVQIGFFAIAELSKLGFAPEAVPGGAKRGAEHVYAYVETGLSDAAAAELEKAFNRLK